MRKFGRKSCFILCRLIEQSCGTETLIGLKSPGCAPGPYAERKGLLDRQSSVLMK